MEPGERARVEAVNALSLIVLATDPVADRPLRLSVASVPVLTKDNHGGQDNPFGLSCYRTITKFLRQPLHRAFSRRGRRAWMRERGGNESNDISRKIR